MNYICAECKHKQDAMNRPCDACGSVRVVAIEPIERLKPREAFDQDGLATPKLTVLSLGWGVQSWTLATMSALRDCTCNLCKQLRIDELPPLDYAIHADTTWEREQTYTFAEQWTPWLEEHGVKVITVQSKRAHTMVHQSSKSDGRYILTPAFTRNLQGEQGQVRRQCTGDWKIDPQDKRLNAVLKELKIKKGPGTVEKWLGISQDEWHRAKHSKLAHVIHRYPLLEMEMTRADCLAWLKAHDLPSPGKSACVFCPFHSRRSWEEIKRKGGHDWETAVAYDEAIRSVRHDKNATKPILLYVHVDRKPLAEAVQIPEDHGMEQGSMFDRVEDDDAATCDSGYCFL